MDFSPLTTKVAQDAWPDMNNWSRSEAMVRYSSLSENWTMAAESILNEDTPEKGV